ncbi:MAG: acetate--CoA ligase family protein [Anaerolineae bacterium]|nr:acetate--CoA ligase family protein [Anaerolineae bacterium]
MDKIHRLFHPAGVVVIGSMSEGKLGYELARQILLGGYTSVFVVNPKGQGGLGIPGYTTIKSINQPLDVAVIASPPDTVSASLIECGEAGISVAVIITSGFGEIGNTAAEEKLKEIARQHNLRIIGPNCAGFVSTSASLYATLEVRPPKGKMAFISQSGAIGGAVLAWADEQGVGVSKFVSYGNRVDLDEIELLPYLADDPDTRVAALYIESVKDGRKFMRAVRNFCQKKPLVVIKSGRTTSGQRAALSHTGSLAGSDHVYDAVLSECGAIRVETIEEMFDLCKGFANLPVMSGRKLAIVTNSGGPGILAADRAEKEGLFVSPPSEGLHRRLSAALPPNCGLNNPLDLTVQGTEEDYRNVITAVLKEYDAILSINVATPYLDSLALARGITDAAAQSDKPVVANFMAGEIVTESIAYLKNRGVPNYPIGERAVSVLARMAEYEKYRLAYQEEYLPAFTAQTLSKNETNEFLEPDAMQWLANNHIPVPQFFFARNVEEVTRGCMQIGFPVVLKVVSPHIIHKSDYGGVILNIQSEAEAISAFQKLEKIAQGKDFRGAMIYPMLPKTHEIILGFSHDPQFGPVVMLGLGGIFTEILKDIVIRTAPLSAKRSWEMIRSLKSYPILAGIRGQKPCNLEALTSLISNFSNLPWIYPEIKEVDLNPILLYEQEVLAADVRVILKEQ